MTRHISNHHASKKEVSARKPKPCLNAKKIWLLCTVITATIAVIVIFLLLNRQNKISDAYDKCKEEFVAIEGEAEEANDKKYDATIFFKPGTPKETLESLSSIMNSFAKVKDVIVATSEDEYQKFIEENKNDSSMSNMLADDEMRKMMLDSMDATMRVKAYDSSDLSSIKNVVENNSEFRKYIDDEKEPVYNKTPQISFGKLELLDNGKTIIMEIKRDNYADKVGCVCSALNMPDRVKDAIGQTVASDGTRRDEWDDINVEWSYRNDKLHIVIYQK